jgi:hypothetical protein
LQVLGASIALYSKNKSPQLILTLGNLPGSESGARYVESQGYQIASSKG